MDDNEDCFISFPLTHVAKTELEQSGRLFFSQKNQYYEEYQQQKSRWGGQQCPNDEVMDEQLLAKMSQLHESLRNKKLLQFQLIQAQIMKDQHRRDSNAIREEIEKIQMESIEAEIESKPNQRDIEQLKKEIEEQRAKNRRHLKQIEEANHKILKTKQKKEEILQKEQFKQNISSQNKFISVEKVRLAAENQSKDEIIAQIKVIIGEMKEKIKQKEKQHQELEDQYQRLLDQVKKQEKIAGWREKSKVMLTEQTNCRNGNNNLSVCQHQESTVSHQNSQDISKNSAKSIKNELAKKRSYQKNQSLLKPNKVIQNDQRSVALSTKTKKKDKINSIR